MLNEKDESYFENFKSVIKYAISKANNHSTDANVTFNYAFEEYDGTSVFEVVNASCSLMTKDVIMVISPDISNNIAIQADVFNKVKMPLLAPTATDSYLKTAGRSELLLMAPSDMLQAQAVVDLLTKYRWTKLSLVASDSNYGIHSATTIQQLLIETTAEVTVQEEFDTSVYFFEAVSDPTQIDLDDILKNMVDSLDRVFVLHCEDFYGKYVLQKAYDAGLLSKDFVWIVTESIVSNPQALKLPISRENPRLHFPTYYEGLIGISIYVDTQNPAFRAFRSDVMASLELEDKDITPAITMLYDAVMLATQSLRDNAAEMERIGVVTDARCGDEIWQNGEDVTRFLATTKYSGASGSYNFDSVEEAGNNQYRIVNFINPGIGLESGFAGIGTWSTAKGLDITSNDVQFLSEVKETPRGIANTLKGQHLKVGATHAPPFAMRKEGCHDIACWSGICPKIVARLAADLNFTYEFIEPADGRYGHFNNNTEDGNGEWDGMVGDLLKNRIDIIAMDLSVSSQRRSYIDFTFSYQDSGISIVIKGESKTDNKFFFLSPFAFSTWVAIIIAFAIISSFQVIFGRLSPYDQHEMMAFAVETCHCQKCGDKRDKKEIEVEDEEISKKCLAVEAQKEINSDTFSLNNALWVVGGNLMGQGGEPLPRSPSGRMILMTWWFFVVLITNMYAANLTAFMTLDKQGVPISSAKDLLAQQVYKWGVQHNSVTSALLEHHIHDTQKALQKGSQNVSSFEDGMRQVYEGGFALVEDTLWLEYNISDSCDIFFVGEKLLTIPVAFGLPMNSPLARLFNRQILKYREEGYFQDLWNEDGRKIEDRKCGKDNVGNDKTLNFKTLVGIFLVLLIGLMVSVGLLLLEIIMASIYESSDNDLSFIGKLKRRLKLAFSSTRFQRKLRRRRKKQNRFSTSTNSQVMNANEGTLIPSDKP